MTPEAVATLLGWTDLHRAASRGATDDVRRLIADGADPEASSIDGWRPLFVAALAGHAAVVEALLSAGVDRRPVILNPGERIASRVPLAEVACRSGDVATVRAIGERVDPATFFLAAHARRGHRLLKLSDAGVADGDMSGVETAWPELWAVDAPTITLDDDVMAFVAPFVGEQAAEVIVVGGVRIVVGARVEERIGRRFDDPEPPPGLRGAWHAPFVLELAPLLLGDPAQVLVGRQRALLVEVLRRGWRDAARVLATRVGASSDAFYAAVDLDDAVLAALLLPMVNPPWPDGPGGLGPLGYAASRACPRVTSELLARGARVEVGSHRGVTPLMLAVEQTGPRARDAVTALLEHGAAVNAAHPTKRTTALMRAAARGDVEIVDRLLRAGADVHAVDSQGRTALDHARADDRDVVELLVGRGAVRTP